MIGIGLIALTKAWVQHHQELAILKKAGPMPYSLAGLIAVFVAGLDIVALIAVSLRW